MNKKVRISALVPMTPAAVFDVWKLNAMVVEMWSSAFTTISSRTAMWETRSPFDSKMMLENQRMVTEKLAASWEIGVEIQKAWMKMLSGNQTPWWTTGRRTIKPLHRRTTANSKRLS